MTNERWNERNVVLTVRCRMCGNTKAIYVTEESWEEYNSPNRRLVQEIFSYLSAEDRELLISNTCNECWNKMFSFEEEDDEEEEEFDFEKFDEYLKQTELSCEELNEKEEVWW